jgi:hypothetical protein
MTGVTQEVNSSVSALTGVSLQAAMADTKNYPSPAGPEGNPPQTNRMGVELSKYGYGISFNSEKGTFTVPGGAYIDSALKAFGVSKEEFDAGIIQEFQNGTLNTSGKMGTLMNTALDAMNKDPVYKALLKASKEAANVQYKLRQTQNVSSSCPLCDGDGGIYNADRERFEQCGLCDGKGLVLNSFNPDEFRDANGRWKSISSDEHVQHLTDIMGRSVDVLQRGEISSKLAHLKSLSVPELAEVTEKFGMAKPGKNKTDMLKRIERKITATYMAKKANEV